MKYYLKNGKVIARSYSTSYGCKFEIGTARDEKTSPCVMNDFFTTSSFHLHSVRALQKAERQLGDVTTIQDLEEIGGMEEQRRRRMVNSAMREMRCRGVFNEDEVRNYLLRLVEGIEDVPMLTYDQALAYYELITA